MSMTGASSLKEILSEQKIQSIYITRLVSDQKEFVNLAASLVLSVAGGAGSQDPSGGGAEGVDDAVLVLAELLGGDEVGRWG
jgi:hypothetical protein